MRDPNRIDFILSELSKVWKLHPDWRLCQLLYNIAISTSWLHYEDLFYFEDEKLLAGLEKKLKET